MPIETLVLSIYLSIAGLTVVGSLIATIVVRTRIARNLRVLDMQYQADMAVATMQLVAAIRDQQEA